jgi:glutamyl-Q tRNA(Asp) synthetase
MHAAIKRTGALTWVEIGADPKQDHETLMAEPQRWGDVVLARKDTPTSYHLSVVVDDALQGVTHVVRGQDLYQATSVHRVLQALLELPPPLYHHHRLILDAEGHKLSKSTQATALRELRQQGRKPADIRRMVGLA